MSPDNDAEDVLEKYFGDISQNKIVGSTMDHIDEIDGVFYGIHTLFHTHFDPSEMLLKASADGQLLGYIPVAKGNTTIH